MKGFFLVNKPSGFSTNEISTKIKKCLNRKIGFSGTLDPLAEGLLIFLLGKSTKFSEYFFILPKKYTTTVKIGFSAFTDDVFGKKNNKNIINKIKNKKKKYLLEIINKKKQIPHKFSSNKIKNIRNFKRSRKNKIFKINKKKIYFNYFKILNIKKTTIKIKIECKTGVYVRSLIRDISICLKLNITVISLKRTSIGKYKVKNSIFFLNKINKEIIIKNLLNK